LSQLKKEEDIGMKLKTSPQSQKSSLKNEVCVHKEKS